VEKKRIANTQHGTANDEVMDLPSSFAKASAGQVGDAHLDKNGKYQLITIY